MHRAAIGTVFVSTILTVVCAIQANAAIDTAESRACRIGEQAAFAKPYRDGIVYIAATDSQGLVWGGTAFRIGGDLLLTAGHVVIIGKGVFAKPRTLVKAFPLQSVLRTTDILNPATPTIPLKIVAHGNVSQRSTDWAILSIDRSKAPTEIANFFVSKTPVLDLDLTGRFQQENDQPVATVGFPGACMVGGSNVLVAAAGKTKSVWNQKALALYPRFSFWLNSAEFTVLIEHGSASAGSSGAPLIYENNGKPIVIGILTGGMGNVGAYAPISGSLRDKLLSLQEKHRIY